MASKQWHTHQLGPEATKDPALQNYLNEEVKAFIEFEVNGTGHLQFGLVSGNIDSLETQRDGKPVMTAAGCPRFEAKDGLAVASSPGDNERMLLTITTTHRPANDLGFLLHKHPDRCQSFDLSFGKVHVFYPEAGAERCTACLLLDVDPVAMIRGKNANFALGQYVNDRPYTASSFMSVAIAQVFGSALQGRCKDRPELAATAIPLAARIDVLPVRGGDQFLRRVFEPLGYEIEAVCYPLDERQEFRDWANGIAGRFGYAVRFVGVGPEDEKVGAPTQMGVFRRT